MRRRATPGYFPHPARPRPFPAGDHTADHPDPTTLDAAGQEAEIRGAHDHDLAGFGDSPLLMPKPAPPRDCIGG
ncbi:hypothetical protein [Streptomyces sp. MK7]|uniref:hypothetical protein n=1 Tax=Streptomyces sp. MK7 TaxID=3067635 RepID=UPI0029311B39|nr:hypothetical protein [Streptomyces sp. MK7]